MFATQTLACFSLSVHSLENSICSRAILVGKAENPAQNLYPLVLPVIFLVETSELVIYLHAVDLA